MNIRSTLVISILSLTFGVAIGFIIRNYPVFTFDKSIKINEAIDTVVTVFVGIALPLLAKKYFDKLDSESNFLVSEISVFEQRTNELKQLIQNIHKAKKITVGDKEAIDTEFEFYDIDFSQLSECIRSFSNNDRLQAEFNALSNQYFLLWRLATGKSINDSKVKVMPLESYKKITKAFIKQHAHLRKLRTLYKNN